ncbi:MAG: sensor histidine kinase [Myxococcaceae bacterium]
MTLEANERLVLSALEAEKQTSEANQTREIAEKRVARLKVVENVLLTDALFRDRFLGIVGHDLSTPLLAISMSAEALRQCGRDKPPDVLVDRILRSAQQMNVVIRQLFDLTRVKAGQNLAPKFVPLDLGQLCTDAVEELEHARRQSGRFVLQFEGALAGRWVAGQLHQLISNLCSNALIHGAQDRPIVVRLRGLAKAVVLDVINEGPAIPKHLLPQLFEPYRQAEPGKNEGLGLGLHIVAEIIRFHRGSIRAQSNAEQTLFSVRLPRHPPTRHGGVRS